MAAKRLPKKVTFKGSTSQSLTKTELEVLHYLTTEYLTPKQVAIRRQTGIHAVNKTIRKLKEKGVINQYLEKVTKIQPTTKKSNQIRLHAEEFNIKILYKDSRYKKLIAKNGTFMLDGNTIRLYNDSIEVYSGQSFYADTTQKADLKAREYWQNFFIKLENNLKVIINKKGYMNIARVNQHYAEINNELAKDMNKKGEKLRIYDNEDGKLWLTIDNSHNLNEMECLHPKTAKEDINKIKPFLDDLRKELTTMNELRCFLKDVLEVNKETAAGLNAVVQLLKPTQEEAKNEPENRKIPEYIN